MLTKESVTADAIVSDDWDPWCYVLILNICNVFSYVNDGLTRGLNGF